MTYDEIIERLKALPEGKTIDLWVTAPIKVSLRNKYLDFAYVFVEDPPGLTTRPAKTSRIVLDPKDLDRLSFDPPHPTPQEITKAFRAEVDEINEQKN
jgi:hypothetical protein